ncbi:MAG: hypothetical protein H0T42_28825 [Deltaproteobacteria bacterium]|nr:hypothetical protein [Deltaproteobacteria bacterium]
MSFGIVEVITLFLGMSGFGLQTNPKAPTAEQSLMYAMPDADVVVHFDAASVVPGNYKVLQNLPNQPQIKATPELAKMVRQAIGEVEGARGLAKGMTGIDLVTDISDATIFLQIVPQQDPNFVAVVHGKFSTGTIDKIAKMSRATVTKVGGGVMMEKGNDPAIGVTKDGIMIAGTASLVRDRLGDAWRAPARATGSNLAFAAEVLGAKPIYAVVLTMSATARKEALTKMGADKNFVTDLVQRHKAASFSVFVDGIGWTWIDSTRAGVDAMAMMSEGSLELLRALQIAPRGFAKIALGAIDSYKGTDKQIDELIRRKGDVLKIVESYTGDGNFKTKIDRDAKANKLTVRATGKTLSEVVPAGFFIPAAIIGMLTVRGAAQPPPPMQMPAPGPQPSPAPAKKSPGLGGKKA